MAEMVNVAVDAMGGDNAPGEIVKGAVEAINAEKKSKSVFGRQRALVKGRTEKV